LFEAKLQLSVLLFPRDFPGSVVLALHEFGHAAAEVGAGAIGRDTLGLLARGSGAVSANRPAVECEADFAPVLGVAKRGIRHGGDKNRDKRDACDNRPFSF
jgi:hypothetical protein